MSRYNFRETEAKWQRQWRERRSFEVREDAARPKYYVLEMFPYPSGKLHVGHVRNYTMGDLVARYRRAQGHNVLHPMGWDAFGLPAENAAIAGNTPPAVWTSENIATMRAQLQRMGFSYDWSREIATCHPEYYRHEQKMFLDFLAADLAYRKESWVNWDPEEHTVLANEQVIEGRGWRSGALVEKRLLSQWFLRITAFSDELLEALSTLDRWPERVRLMQENWIGRSEGARVRFAVAGREQAVEKRGYPTGLEAVLPLDPKRRVPVYVANFVLMEYGTGAIFGCPAHDQRDLDFVNKYGLGNTPVVCPEGQDPKTFVITDIAYDGDGRMINSRFLDGMTIDEAKEEVAKRLEGEMRRNAAVGERQVNFRL